MYGQLLMDIVLYNQSSDRYHRENQIKKQSFSFKQPLYKHHGQVKQSMSVLDSDSEHEHTMTKSTKKELEKSEYELEDGEIH